MADVPIIYKPVSFYMMGTLAVKGLRKWSNHHKHDKKPNKQLERSSITQ